MKSIQLANNSYNTVLNALIALGFTVDSTSGVLTYLKYKECNTTFFIESYNLSRGNVCYFGVVSNSFRMCIIDSGSNNSYPTVIRYESIAGGGIVMNIGRTTSDIKGFVAIAEPSVKTNNKFVVIASSYFISGSSYLQIDDAQYLDKIAFGMPIFRNIQTDYIQLVKMIDSSDGEEFDNIYIITTNPYGTDCTYIEFYASNKKFVAFDLLTSFVYSSGGTGPKIAFEITDD